MDARNTFLVIDDDTDFVEGIQSIAARDGWEVVHTADTDYAVELVTQQKPALIVLNADIPGGFAFCRKIKNHQELKQIPLVLVTMRASEETIENHKTLPTRADYYFRKPVGLDKIAELLPQRTQPVQEESSVEELKSEVASLNREREVLQNRLTSVDTLEKQIQTYQSTIRTLESSTNALNQRIQMMENELRHKEELEKGYQRQIKELKANEGLIESLNQQIESMTALFEKLERGYKQRIDGLTQDNDALSSRIMELERSLSSAVEQKSQLESRVKGYDVLRGKAMEADNLREEIQQLETEISELRDYRDRMEPLVERVENMQALEAELEATIKERDELLALVGDMEPQLKKAQEDLRHVSEDYRKLQTKLDEIRNTVCPKE